MAISSEITFDTTPTPPVATKVSVTTELHGEKLVDEFAWLRGKEKPEVIDYLNAENAYFEAVMKPTQPLQEKLYKEMLGRIKETDLSVPTPKHGWLYYSRTQAGKNYPIYCRKKTMRGKEQVLLDINKMAEGKKFFSVAAMQVSDDGNLLAFTTDDVGYRQYKLFVKDLRSGEVGPMLMPRVDAVEWGADNRTLFVIQEDEVTKRSNKLFRVALNTGAPKLLKQEDDGLYNVYLDRTMDGRYIVFGSASEEENDVFVIDARKPSGNPRNIFARKKKERHDLEHNNGKFYVKTDKGAKNFRIISAPVGNPSQWSDVIPHDPKTRISFFVMLEKFLAVGDRSNGLPGIRILDLQTLKIKRLKFDDATYSVSPSGNEEFATSKLRYSYSSPVKPAEVMEMDLNSGRKKVLKRIEVPGFDGAKYATERIWATATDGKKVPIGLVYRKDKKRQHMPTLLYGYGSYGASAGFGFSSNVVSLLDRGYVYAVAQIRGGSEMGEEWYEDGKMAHKMNTFTDFISCADYLVSSGRTDRDKLGIMGGSAGGLLMGAVMNLRPDVCKAAIVLVPFVDVINTMLDESLPLTTGEFIEWGNPKIEEQYRWIRAYSPYENIRDAQYPVMLVETSLNDSQVGYHEPAKYVARMRDIRTDKSLLLFKCRMDGGHGGASGRYDSLRDTAMQYAFLLVAIGD